MAEPITTVSFSLTPDLKRRIDAMVSDFQREFPGLRATRSSIVRSILLRWMESETPATRTRTRKRNQLNPGSNAGRDRRA
jgi:Arc/MetJ-type ribon-helix-helix transcriptional regulator